MKRNISVRIISIIIIVSAIVIGVGLGFAYAKKQVPTTVAQQTGVTVYTDSAKKATIDASNLAEGYVLVKYTGGKDVRIRVQITKTDGTAYTYDINNKGTFEAFPLAEGDGNYTIRVFEQASGNKYAVIHTQQVTFKARNELLPFMYPNQFVNYTADGNAAKLAVTVVGDKTKQMDKIVAIYNHVVGGTYTYDYELAATVASGYLPVLDKFLEVKKGICFDYSSLMTAMLRSQGIPCRLVIGYANDATGAVIYHAWIDVYTPETGWIANAISFNGETWALVDPTFISTGKQSAEVLKWVADTTNYSAKYVY